METNQKPIGDGCTLASSDGPPVNDCYQLVYIDAGGWEVLDQYGCIHDGILAVVLITTLSCLFSCLV